MIYIKVDLAHALWSAALTDMTAKFLTERQNNILSVNRNAAGTVAWIKLVADPLLEAVYPGVIIDKATEAQHAAKVQADVYTPGWYPEE